MSFKRMEGFVGSIPQAFIDRNLKKCPFCGSNYPHWGIDEKMELTFNGNIYLFQCEQCKGILSAPVHDVSGFSNSVVTGMGLLKIVSGKQLDVVYMKIYDAGNNPECCGIVGNEYTLPQIIQMAENKASKTDDTPRYYNLQQELKQSFVVCPECGSRVRNNLPICPECGFPLVDRQSLVQSANDSYSDTVTPIKSHTIDDYLDKTCPFCKTKFQKEDTIVICNTCELPHHLSCWQENNGCTTFGCTGNIEEIIGNNQLDELSSFSGTVRSIPLPISDDISVIENTSPMPNHIDSSASSRPYVFYPSSEQSTKIQRYETLFESCPQKIQKNIPVLIEKISLIIDHVNNELVARCFFCSLTDKPMIAMLVNVSCTDVWGNTINGIEGFQYLDLKTKRDSAFGQTTPIIIPENTTRTIDVTVVKVMFSDRTMVEASSEYFILPQQDTLEHFFDESDMIAEYIDEVNVKSGHLLPTDYGDYWKCICGALNGSSETICHSCHADKQNLFQFLDPHLLRARLEAKKQRQRLEEERVKAIREEQRREAQRRIQEAEKRRKEAEERRKKEEALAWKREQKRKAELAKKMEEEKRLRQKRLKKLRKKLYKTTGAFVAAFFLIYLTVVLIIPYARYSYGCNLLKNQSYDEAYQIFHSLGNFGDSMDMADEARYQRAVDNAKHSKWEKASNDFYYLVDYKDSFKQWQESIYQYAIELTVNSEWEKASYQFKRLNNYKDSPEQYKKTRYQYALELASKSEWIKASEEFLSLGDYEDSANQYKKMRYQYALDLASKSEWIEAGEEFLALENYEDSAKQYKEMHYQYALDLVSKSEWVKAGQEFKKLKDYKDSASQYKKIRYQYGLQMLQEKSYINAVNTFYEIGDYKDAKAKANEARYSYVMANKNNTDEFTYKYLKVLKADNYKDSKKIFSSLYDWKVKNIYFSTDEDGSEKKSSISRYKPVYCHFEVVGGPPNGSTYIYCKDKYPDGSSTGKSKSSGKFSSGDTGWWGWSSGIYTTPSRGTKGTLTMYFYDESGNLIGKGSVKIT